MTRISRSRVHNDAGELKGVRIEELVRLAQVLQCVRCNIKPIRKLEVFRELAAQSSHNVVIKAVQVEYQIVWDIL